MKTILDILKKAGGWHPGLYLKIDNPPYQELVIEAMDESGPLGLPALSVAHYGEQNGDLMRDPEMCFELGLVGGEYLDPFYWRNDYVAVEQWSRNIVREPDSCRRSPNGGGTGVQGIARFGGTHLLRRTDRSEDREVACLRRRPAEVG
jgi:hypothetical protein